MANRRIKWETMGDMWPTTDYGRVLRTWGFLGRTGLSLHVLATLLRRHPRVLLRQMLRDRNVHATHCGDIDAPIWINSPMWVGGEEYHREAVTETRRLLRRYPWPKYRSLWGMRGHKKFMDISKFELRILRAAARGRKPVGDYGSYYDDDRYVNGYN